MILKNYFKLIKESKKNNPYRSPLELCSIQLDYLSLQDTFFIKILRGGVMELHAHRKDERDDVIVSVSYEKIIPVLIFMKSHYQISKIKKKDFSPHYYFFYENFSNIDAETRQLFKNIARFFKMPSPLFCTNKFYLHILCRHLAKNIMHSMIMQERYITEHKKSLGGYYWSLNELKKLVESELFN